MKRTSPARQIATVGILLSLALVLSFVERLLPPLPGLPPNSKLGLSNIVVMYSLFFVSRRSTFALMFLKSFFIFLISGLYSGILSLCGGIFSVLIMMLAAKLGKEKLSYLFLSILGALFHNIGQLLAASFLFKENIVLFYLPIMLFLGVIMGTLTGLLLRVVFPTFSRFAQLQQK